MGDRRPRDYAEYIQMKIQGPGFEFLNNFSDDDVIEKKPKRKKRSRCPCGSTCPADDITTTFHVPTCPMSVYFPQPKSPKEGKVCPFAPNPCPLGPNCLFPVTAIYDPDAPLQRNECYCGYQDDSGCSCVPICPLSPPIPPPPVFKECPFINNPKCSCGAKQCPCGAKQCPCGANQCPCGVKQCPSGANQCPCGANQCPSGPNQCPCGAYQCPCGAKQCPCGAYQCPSGANQCPIGANQCPSGPNQCPCGAYQCPCGANQCPCATNQCPCPLKDMKTCLCSEKYRKADYKKYTEKGCPCIGKNVELECPLGVKDCPCLNLTSTNACPLNAIQCPVEQPLAPLTEEEPPKESLEVLFTQAESEIDVKKKKEDKSEAKKKRKLSFSTYEPKRNRIKFSMESKMSINMSNMAKSISFYTMRRSGEKGSLKPEERRSIAQSEKHLKSGCLLEKPKCPMMGAKNEIVNAVSDKKGECPMDLGPCEMFPKGRCPMMELGSCNCNYPVAPCMAPAQCGYVMAPPQYCYKEDCCMGLPLPPTYPASYGRYDTGVYYRFMSWKPGEKTTKHYIEISDEAYPMNFFRGREKREYDNWWIIRGGKGYEECQKVKEIIDKRGPVDHKGVQFDKKDNPLDIETKIILQNRQHREDQRIMLQNTRLPWTDKF